MSSVTDRLYDDAMIDRCCLFLLGELPAGEAAAFEQQSAASGELRACLAEQAELLAELGVALAPRPLPHSQSQSLQPQSLQPHTPGMARWLSSRGAVAAAFALAASLLIWVGLQRRAELDREESPDALQLAHAWAAGRGEAEASEAEASEAAGSEEWSEEWSGGPWRSDPVWQETESPLEPLVEGDFEMVESAAAAEVADEQPGPPQWLVVAVRAMDAEESPASAPPAGAATEENDE